MKKNQIDMLNGSILNGVARVAFPLMLSSILQLLFNAADIIVIGRFGSNNSLAAVGAVSVIWGLCGHIFMSLGGGSTVVAGKNIGAGKKSAVSDVLHVSIALGILLGLAISLLAWLSMPNILWAMQTPEEVFGLALEYIHYLIPGLPAIAVYNFGAGILRAKGDTKRPLYFLFTAGIANVILNLIFVIALKMDVAGVGLATSVSQYIATILIIICLVREEDEFKLEFKKICLKASVVASILKIGIPNVIQNILFTFSNTVIQASINSFGADVMSGNAAAGNIESFCWTAMISVEQAGMSFVSQNFGAGNFKRVKESIFKTLALICATGLFFGELTVLFARPLLEIYTSYPASIAEGIIRLRILCGPYILCGIMSSIAADMRGLGHAIEPSIIVLLGACGTRLLWIFTAFQTPRFHTTAWLLFTYPASWAITGLVLAIFLIRIFKQEKARFGSSA
ncbi:MAG: MATE family efflux transporter [Treponema sp.]|nr:MATE family efflux transporter [Treponema sp.]